MGKEKSLRGNRMVTLRFHFFSIMYVSALASGTVPTHRFMGLWCSGLFQDLDFGSLAQKDYISFSMDFFFFNTEMSQIFTNPAEEKFE